MAADTPAPLPGTSAELELLRQGLVACGRLEAAALEKIAAAAAAAATTPLAYLVDRGALTASTAQTAATVLKGYLRLTPEALFSTFNTAPLATPEAAPRADEAAFEATPPAPVAAAIEAAADAESSGLLGPIPEWGSLEEPVLSPGLDTPSVAPSAAPRPPPNPDPEPVSRRRRQMPAIDPRILQEIPSPGSRIDAYTLREVVSAGASAVVYRAYDERARQGVLLKLLRAAVYSRERERFLSEAQILGRLSHPNIIRLLSSGEHRGAPYIVLENIFVIGLDEHLERTGRESPGFILRVASTAIRGLGAAARAGVYHRDVKPASLLLYASDGRVKVANFGLASDHESLPTDGTGTLQGTPGYMAPERVLPSGERDHRADMYSLGVSLFEAATGRLPFLKSTALETMRAHIYDPTPMIHDLRPGFPLPLAALIERLLSKRPGDRFATWSEALRAFEGVARHLDNPISDAVSRAVQGDQGTGLSSLYRKYETT